VRRNFTNGLFIGKNFNEAIAEEAGTAAVAAAKPLDHNKYLIAAAKTIVKRYLLPVRGFKV
jgi:hypothetical protein